LRGKAKVEKLEQTMEALNISNMFRRRPFLDGFYFLRVNMNPIFIHYKT